MALWGCGIVTSDRCIVFTLIHQSTSAIAIQQHYYTIFNMSETQMKCIFQSLQVTMLIYYI